MLRAILASGAPAPHVLAANDQALVLEVLPDTDSLSCASADLGRVLAVLHGATSERYGWPEDYAFGSVAIENADADDWPTFWAERRLLTSVAHIPSAPAHRIERLAADLPGRLPARPKCSLLHGDLWGGNVLTAGGKVSGLIDPACYYGHGEVDIAMLNLFGSQGSAFYSAYGKMEPGWQVRLAIYKLWPALVHLRLFGSGYRPLVEQLLSEAGV